MSVDEWMNNQSKMLAALAQYRSRSDVSMADYALYRAALRTGLLDRYFAKNQRAQLAFTKQRAEVVAQVALALAHT